MFQSPPWELVPCQGQAPLGLGLAQGHSLCVKTEDFIHCPGVTALPTAVTVCDTFDALGFSKWNDVSCDTWKHEKHKCMDIMKQLKKTPDCYQPAVCYQRFLTNLELTFLLKFCVYLLSRNNAFWKFVVNVGFSLIWWSKYIGNFISDWNKR